jgi:hypothetical protein
MAAVRLKRRWKVGPARMQNAILISGFLVTAVVVLLSPLMMIRLSSNGLPWKQLADVGQAYGGASALLSAAALCGVGASLLFQRRQMRQELADIDREQHRELLRLAIDNPEFIEVIDARLAQSPYARQELYANLMMMYWLAVWQLGEVDDEELRGMVAAMFGSEITRNWWSRVGENWIGTQNRADRRRFVDIVSDELAMATPAVVAGRECTSDPRKHRRSNPARREMAFFALALTGAGLAVSVFRTLRPLGATAHPAGFDGLDE